MLATLPHILSGAALASFSGVTLWLLMRPRARMAALMPRRLAEAVGRLMGTHKLMYEVDHGARHAYEERAAHSEPGLEKPAESDDAPTAPSQKNAA